MRTKGTPAGFSIREMEISDYAAARRIWAGSPGVYLMKDDERPGISVYLKRNRGLCFVAVVNRQVVGTLLCGHDGRRAVLRHLAVVRGQRGRGIGRALVKRSLSALVSGGIPRCSVYVLDDNPRGMDFWKHLGFRELVYDYRTLQAPTRGRLRRRPGGRRVPGRAH